MRAKNLIPAAFAFLLAALCAPALRAQLPSDDASWKERCDALNVAASFIEKGSAPPALVASTSKVPGAKFAAVAEERSKAGQHFVSCTLYYLGAVAEHAGNSGKVDSGAAKTDGKLALAEFKTANGVKIGFGDRMARVGKQAGAATSSLASRYVGGAPVAPTPFDVSVVINAANSMPRPLNAASAPPPEPVAAAPAPAPAPASTDQPDARAKPATHRATKKKS